MPERMTVRKDGQAVYEIIMEQGFTTLGQELAALNFAGRKLCIVTDSNVALLYLEEIKKVAAALGSQTEIFVFAAGEEHKTLDTVRSLYKVLIDKKFDRKDILLALGGGVTGDLCGFAAATYLRGISFVQIPTTLLSQVDSSIGGKTGVDFDAYKNMVGAFHMPALVYINIATLLSLSGEQFASGMGEVIKHGLIKSRDYYDWLWDNRDAISSRDLAVLGEVVRVSDEIKREVVERDPGENGERALLNFGHTLGHAIEKLSNFTMLHGHCVALGALAAVRISVIRGDLTESEYDEIKFRFSAFGLPVTFTGIDIGEIIAATKNDKKMEAGRIKFILLRQIGVAYVDATVTDEEMAQALSAIVWRTE